MSRIWKPSPELIENVVRSKIGGPSSSSSSTPEDRHSEQKKQQTKRRSVLSENINQAMTPNPKAKTKLIFGPPPSSSNNDGDEDGADQRPSTSSLSSSSNDVENNNNGGDGASAGSGSTKLVPFSSAKTFYGSSSPSASSTTPSMSSRKFGLTYGRGRAKGTEKPRLSSILDEGEKPKFKVNLSTSSTPKRSIIGKLEDLANGKDAGFQDGGGAGGEIEKIPEKVPSHRIGFPNRHQTCYLNAILQSLLAQPSLVQNLLDLEFESSEEDDEKFALLKSFCNLTKCKVRGEQWKVRDEILRLKNTLAKLDSQFKGDTMQDADEFLLKFCDTIREQCKLLSSKPVDPISANIEYKTEEILVCSNCGKEKRNEVRDIICKLARPIGAGNGEYRSSIGGLLEKSFSEHQITDWKCESCGLTTALANVRFTQLPRVLILYLPRSDFEVTRAVKTLKIQSVVDIPEKINLSTIVSKEVVIPSADCSLKSLNSSLDFDDFGTPCKKPRIDQTPEKSTNGIAISETPEKLKNLSEEQIGKLSEQDSLALAIRQSLKDNEIMSEEDQLKAAINESLNDLNNDLNGNEVFSSSSSSPELQDNAVAESDQPNSPLDGEGDNPDSAYRLTGVVSHLGSSVFSGHYIADIFRLDQKNWYRYNDMDVHRRTWESVKSGENTRNGYLFLYTHSRLLEQK